MSLREAIRSLGYSKSYSDNPGQLTDTDSWQELMKKHLPDSLLAKVHEGLLRHRQWRARDAGLDKAYKLTNKYGAVVIQHKLGNLSDQDLEGEIAAILSEAIGLTAGKEKKSGK